MKKILESCQDGVVQFIIKSAESEQSTCVAMLYQAYLRTKNKKRLKSRKSKLLKEFSSLSISDKSTDSSPKKPFGMSHLLAKRSLLFENDAKPNFIDLKTMLAMFDVIYVYVIANHEGYYLLFKNRTSLSQFIEILKESPKEVCFKNGNESTPMLLSMDRFKPIDSLNLPADFKSYVKRVKAFFRNPHKAN